MIRIVRMFVKIMEKNIFCLIKSTENGIELGSYYLVTSVFEYSTIKRCVKLLASRTVSSSDLSDIRHLCVHKHHIY